MSNFIVSQQCLYKSIKTRIITPNCLAKNYFDKQFTTLRSVQI